MSLPKHVAIIMDGNGRWAKSQNKPRTYGHEIGAKNIKNIIEAGLDNKIKFLTLFAFSCENWNRPKHEVNFLLKLLDQRINKKLIDYLNDKKIKFNWLGFEKKIDKKIVKKIRELELITKHNKLLNLTIAFNYGGKQDILNAAKYSSKNVTMSGFNKLLLTKSALPDVDLLIRTGGDKRISNFLLWQSAYAEIIFEPTYWPIYNQQHFANNILEYCSRQRRFGQL